MSSEQVLTQRGPDQPEISALDQSPSTLGDVVSASAVPLLVIAPETGTGSGEHDQPRHQHGLRPGPESRKTKRGGWPSSACLTWSEVKEIDSVVHELAARGHAPTHLVTIMPLVGDDSSRKRACSREIAHLGQALKRHGEAHIGLTVFEHPLGADLHAHHLVHAPVREHATVERRHRPPEVHVARIDDLRDLTEYLTKERRRLSPDFEAMIQRRWQRCQPVTGKRWTMTTDARNVLRERSGRAAERASHSSRGLGALR